MAFSLAIGCSHYRRKCKIVAPCCQNIYICRFCHDERENHPIDRRAIQKVICMICDLKQPVQYQCKRCRTCFGKYFCRDCNFFDDDNKGQFHCSQCGTCFAGGSQNFFHCKTCNRCVSYQFMYVHKCIENLSHSNCPVCVEDMHSSGMYLHILQCGHLLHELCFKNLHRTGHFFCPVCKEPWKK